MRSVKLSLLALLLTAPALSATEDKPANAAVAEAVPAVIAEPATEPGAEMRLTEVRLEERAVSSDDAAAAQLGPRGSFWWIVGVVVVAGVILAVLT